MSAKLVNSNIYKRDEKGNKYAPAWVIYTMPIFVIILAVSIICVLWNIYRGNLYGIAIPLILFILSGFWGIYTEYHYEYYEKCIIEFKEDYVLYKFNLNKSVIPSSNSTVEVKIKDLRKVKVKGKMAVLHGDILKISPFKKTKKLKKVSLPINFTEKEEILSKLQNIIKGDM